MFHDDLADVNDPCWFHEFADHAERHRLQFLCEAEMVATSYFGLAPAARQVLDELDPLVREQYLDFAKCRRFRQTLLCRAEVAVDRRLEPGKVAGFRFASRRQGVTGEAAAIQPPAARGARGAGDHAMRSTMPRRMRSPSTSSPRASPGPTAQTCRSCCLAAARRRRGAAPPTHAPKLGATLGDSPGGERGGARAGRARAER